MTKYTKPKVVEHTHHREGAKEYFHPSYGQIAAHRVTGRRELYASEFDHSGFIRITVRRSTRTRDLATNWYHSGQELIELDMSYAQWLEFITTMNVGTGTPCTLVFFQGQGELPQPIKEIFNEEFQGELDKKLANIMYKMTEALKEAQELADGKRPSAKDRLKLVELLYFVLQDLESNMDYLDKQYKKHWEETTARAKAEIDSFLSEALRNLGAEALQEKIAATMTPMLPKGEDE
jgi:hypothetical protein